MPSGESPSKVTVIVPSFANEKPAVRSPVFVTPPPGQWVKVPVAVLDVVIVPSIRNIGAPFGGL